MESDTLPMSRRAERPHIKSHGSLLRELKTRDRDNGMDADDDAAVDTMDADEQAPVKELIAKGAAEFKVTRPRVPMSSFVGLPEVKKDILNYLDKKKGAGKGGEQEFFEENDRVLIFGETGTGKTHLVRALATKLRANLVEFEIPSIEKWLQNLDEYTKALYEICGEQGPLTILFLDNLDVFCIREEDKRGMVRFIRDVQGSWEKNNLEAAEVTAPKRLIVIGSTNKPNLLEEKLVYGFDRRVYVPTLNFHERRQLFERTIETIWKYGNAMAPGDLDWVARKTYGILGSEVEVLVDKALKVQYPRWPLDLEMGEAMPQGTFEPVHWRSLEVDDFLEVLRGFAVLDSKAFFEFETFQRKFGNGPFMRIYDREDWTEEGESKKGKKKRSWVLTALAWL